MKATHGGADGNMRELLPSPVLQFVKLVDSAVMTYFGFML